MPDKVYGWVAIGLVPIFLAAAIVLAILEFGCAGWVKRHFGGRKLIPTLCIASGVVLIGIGLAIYPFDMPPDPVVAPPQDRPKPPTAPRALDVIDMTMLIMRDFPNDASLGVELLYPNPLVRATYGQFMTNQNLERRYSYNVIYIPPEAVAERVAMHVLGQIEQLRDYQTPAKERPRKYGDKIPVLGERLAFSDKIYIYHAAPLNEEQRERIWNAYRNKGYTAEFRGPEHIAEIQDR